MAVFLVHISLLDRDTQSDESVARGGWAVAPFEDEDELADVCLSMGSMASCGTCVVDMW